MPVSLNVGAGLPRADIGNEPNTPTVNVVLLALVIVGPDAKKNMSYGLIVLDTPPTVTTTYPVVVPLGTGVTMLVALQDVGVADTPLNVIVLAPCDEPKFVPVMVTDAPTIP